MKSNLQFKKTRVGKIPKHWEVKSLEYLCEKITDGSHFSPKTYPLGMKRIATVKNMNEFSFDLQSCKKISDQSYDELVKNGCKPEKGEVLFSKDGTIGLSFVFENNIDLVLLSSIAILRPKKIISPHFLNYYLRDKKIQNYLKYGHTTGSALPRIVLKDLKLLPVVVPPKNEQEKIVNYLLPVFKSIEQLIELNLILEKILLTIFKSWFVNFDTQKDFYDSELGSVPKGWKVVPIGEIAEFVNGFSYKGSEKYKIPKGHVFVTLNNIKEGGGFKPKYSWIVSDRLKERHFVSEQDLIIANTEQTKNGRLLATPAIVLFPFFYKKQKGVFSHHITKVIPKNSYMKFFLFSLFYYKQYEIANAYHSGTGVWGFDYKNFQKHFLTIRPTKEILDKFELIGQFICGKILENEKQVQLLSEIRDNILPKLMSGEI